MSNRVSVSGNSSNGGSIKVSTTTVSGSASAETVNGATNVDTVNNAAWHFSELSKKWAISEILVENTDYSSKYYAGKSKEYYESIETLVEDVIEDAVEEVTEKAEAAADSAEAAAGSAETAQMYAGQSSTGMIWIEIKEEEWEQDVHGLYKREIENLLAVAAVYKGSWNNKTLQVVNIETTNEKSIIFAYEPFDGWVLSTTAIIEPEEEILASVQDVQATGVINASREGRTVTLKSTNFVFEQAVASDEWVIVHNLNKRPSVELVDSAGTQFQARIVHNSNNQCTVYINGATTGKAYLN